MKYIDALKKYNEGKDKWCMPRKGSEDYLNIIRMMKPISKKKDKLDLLNVSGRNNNCFFNSIYLVIKDNNDFKKSSRYSIKKGEDLRKYLCKKFIKEANIKKTIKKYQTYLELAQLYLNDGTRTEEVAELLSVNRREIKSLKIANTMNINLNKNPKIIEIAIR